MSSVNIDYTYNGTKYTNMYAFEYWKDITDTTSKEYEFKKAVGENYNSEGFGIANGRYVIACTETFGTIGDYLNFTLADGTVLQCVMGETKNSADKERDSYWTPMGHVDLDTKTMNVIEFLVNYSSWGPGSGHDNPGTPTCHPEWAGQIQKCENLGNYWSGSNPSSTSSTQLAYITCKRVFDGQKDITGQYLGNVVGSGIFFNDSEFFWYDTSSKITYMLSGRGNSSFWNPTIKVHDVTYSLTSLSTIANSSTSGTATASNYNVEQAVQWAVTKAQSGTITYSQENRTGPTSYDCSSFIAAAFQAAGFNIDPASVYTGNMIEVYSKLGFNWVAMSPTIPASVLTRGDILLNINAHTQMYIGNNQDVNCGSTPAKVQDHVATYSHNGYYGWNGYLHYVGV